MEITIKADAKEIAALVMALQERQDVAVLNGEEMLETLKHRQSEECRTFQ